MQKNAALTNIIWLLFDKFFRLSLSLVVVIWLARYLGPEQFGTLNYALALVSIVGTAAALGLNGLVVRDLVREPLQSDSILGSAFALKVGAAVSGYFVVVCLLLFLRVDELTMKLCLILSLTFLFKTSDVVKYWFESQVQSKYVVIVENGVFAAIVLIKLLLIYFGAPLIAFAWIYIAEVASVAFWLFCIYRFKHSTFSWFFSVEKSRQLLAECWPLIVSVAAWILYSRVDQIMIGQLINAQAVGYFSAAVRISEVSNMLPAIIVMSVMPGVIKLQKTSPLHYRKRMQNIYDLCVVLMLCVAVITQLFADVVVELLFTSSFAEAANVLRLQIWTGIFLALALVSSRYLINEGQQKLLMFRNLIGLLLNVPLNYIFIPLLGIQGAALASLISVIFVSYIFDLSNTVLRPVFMQKTRALLLMSCWQFIGQLFVLQWRKYK
ncbi:flippase [Rheinheimera baltica]|uniref:Flippase n=1 Tax=Rheinheimera baltica TaxID=67576 RepID=A0ABT9HW89_9GAMM|nr:flippase [Rheinheimera baltica]MDP5134941.1 flippase [Rheinheimera baltica]